MSGHGRTKIRRATPPNPDYWLRSAWMSTCTCGERYLTDGGWEDAMVWALSHRVPEPPPNRVLPTKQSEAAFQRAHVGWTFAATPVVLPVAVERGQG